MVTKKKMIKIGIIIVAIFFVVYLISYIFFSIKINNALDGIINSKQYTSLNNDVIVSKANYRWINPQENFEIRDECAKEKYDRTPLFLVFGFNKIYAYYEYEYEGYDKDGELIAGCADMGVKVTLGFSDGKLTILDWEEDLFNEGF